MILGFTLPNFLLFLFLQSLFLVPASLYCRTLQRAVARCAPESRTFPSWTIWLLLAPAVNIIWHFYVVVQVGHSLRNELLLRGVDGAPASTARDIGLLMCIATLLVPIPGAGIWAGACMFVCWIIFWKKVATLSRALAGIAAPAHA